MSCIMDWRVIFSSKMLTMRSMNKTDIFADYASRPSILRERYQDHHGFIIIDEIQMVPDLLNEIHWLIENSDVSFLMTGSSARKLQRGHANLLGVEHGVILWHRLLMEKRKALI